MADTIADGWKRQSDAWEKLARELDAENDDLRRENEAFRKVLGTSGKPVVVTMPGAIHKVNTSVRVRVSDASPATERSADAPSEMCCGGTCVRAVCKFHGPQGASA